MSAPPSWMTEGCSEVRRAQIQRDWAARRPLPRIPLVTVQVDDITDASRFPNIAEARKWFDGLSPERQDEINKEWEG